MFFILKVSNSEKDYKRRFRLKMDDLNLQFLSVRSTIEGDDVARNQITVHLETLSFSLN